MSEPKRQGPALQSGTRPPSVPPPAGTATLNQAIDICRHFTSLCLQRAACPCPFQLRCGRCFADSQGRSGECMNGERRLGRGGAPPANRSRVLRPQMWMNVPAAPATGDCTNTQLLSCLCHEGFSACSPSRRAWVWPSLGSGGAGGLAGGACTSGPIGAWGCLGGHCRLPLALPPTPRHR